MLYYIAEALRDQYGPLNVLTYHTVRAGGAALTGFLFCLLFGPAIIERLRALKVGQYIRQEHVEDLHEIHKTKAGTPTMGGAMILIATVLSLLLWARWDNRLLWIAVIVLCSLGTVGFIDDFIKLRRKHNDGLSAKAKFTGQILTGLFLGVYLFYSPITASATYLTERSIPDWPSFLESIQTNGTNPHNGPAHHVWDNLDVSTRAIIEAIPPGETPDLRAQELILDGLNDALVDTGTFAGVAWDTETLSVEAMALLDDDTAGLGRLEQLRLNRLMMEGAFPGTIVQTQPDLHTKVNVPGFKEWLIPLGIGYALFVIVIIVASSNAVNLTDGLDGLAIGAATMSLLAYTGIAYVISRADWSEYLYLIYVPEASELFVFGAALLGTGLGFLWFNSHPAEVFMGDTGSLALGGAIGTMAILTKQELLLLLVGGLFVVEAGSVIVQVLSFKLRGKRVFKMAPIHHHFELLGWSETKVVTRFWILALLFALMSLATLKLR